MNFRRDALEINGLAPRRALPVDPLDLGIEDEATEVDDYRAEEVAPAPRAIRALPVETDEVIEDEVEEP